ncbi:MAG TPA: single-stranded-DNA-specific exonuclease RecJ, partial [Abditibacteriaceae bacterium]|nr:single-stranded-DNA-specific exonuclease RecJ [Abditibacteriaceae bacterium]
PLDKPIAYVPAASRAAKQNTAPIATRWHAKTALEAGDAVVAAACGISPVTAAVLRTRGYTTAAAIQEFFEPHISSVRDPYQLPDIKPALERLHRAITSGERLLVFGDYDVDGLASTALLVRALRALKANVSYQIPERGDGYGLSLDAVEKAAADGFSLILTADCGITAHEPVQRARELGLDVIITDHHDPGTTLPPALAVVNPKRADSNYGFRELCGCGVAFKVMQALMREYWPRHADSFTDKFVELAGLAAIADCVPLVDENRFLAREALRRLATTNKPGLQALIKVARVKITGDSLCGRHVSFSLAPRLNAAGRVDSARKGLALLLSSDEVECEELAQELEEHNRLRQEATHRIMDEARALVLQEVDLTRDFVIVVAGENWPRGIVGLVASRLAERYARPAVVLGMADGKAHGSGRSFAGFNLHTMLEHTRPLLVSGGGHPAACGLCLEATNLAAFRQQVLEYAATQLKIENLVPTVEADCEVAGHDLTPQVARDLEKLEPCGTGNPEALLMLRKARILDTRAIGADGAHIKWQLFADGRRFDAVWWRPGEKGFHFRGGQEIDLCFLPQLNHWNGNTTLQLIIKDARLC